MGNEDGKQNMSVEEMINSGDPALNKKAISMMTEENGVNTDTSSEAGVENTTDNTGEETAGNSEENSERDTTPENNDSSINAGYQNKEEDYTQEHTQEYAQPPENYKEDSQKSNENQRNMLSITYRGKPVEIDDSDGFLGRKDVNGLKKANAHARAYIQDIERQIAEKEQELKEARQERAQWQQHGSQNYRQSDQNSSLEQPAQQSSQQPEQSNSGQQEQDSQEEGLQPPDAPVLPSDPYDWTESDVNSFNEYMKKNRDYQAKMAKYLSGTKGSGDDNKIAELENKIKEQQTIIDRVNQDYQEKERQSKEKSYWDTIENFRNNHKEYREANKNIRNLHQEVDTWMNRLANSMGYNHPYDRDVKLKLAQQYLNGDTSVTNTGTAPPEGYKEYFKLAELMGKKQEYVNDGMLGQNSTLHDVWLLEQDRNGLFQSGFEQAEKDALNEGKSSAMRAISGRQQNNAKNIPNNANTMPPENSNQNDQVSQQEANQLLNMSPEDLMKASPEVRQKRNMLLKQFSNVE